MQLLVQKRKYVMKRAKKAGFTLLLAALVASIVVSLGAAIFQVARKQVLLSGVGRDSQFAFYAADTAAECALYWDFRYGYFASTTPTITPAPTCDGVALTIISSTNLAYPFTKSSQAPINLFVSASPSGGYCAEVRVLKCQGQGPIQPNGTCNYVGPTDPIRTLIHADGYSVRCADKNTSPRALQRSIELRY
jgi:hypothetical protein